MRIIMLGASDTGKSTQTKKIATRYQIPRILTGDTSRASTKNGTELGMKAKSYMNASDLVPDEITIGMLLGRIHEEDYKNGYVLDRSSGTIPQTESLTKTLGDMGEAIDYVISMDVPDENIANRMFGRHACLSCGATYHIIYNPPKKERICDVCGQQLVLRDDDKPETAEKRLNVYHGQIRPLIEYYERAGILVEVDGTLDMEKVSQAIIRILGA